MWCLFALVYLVSLLSRSLAVEMKQISVLTVTGINGGSAALPCDVSHPPADHIYLILWFRDTLTTPIYRFDDRSAGRERKNHWSDNDQLGSRATLEVSSSQAFLRLSSLTLSDQGFYKCRVDFKLQPTKTTRVSLTVVVPPRGVSISVATQGSVPRPVTRVVGPYLEGDTIYLTCTVLGGLPRSAVIWYEDRYVIDRFMESEEPEITTTEFSDPLVNTTLNPWPAEVTPILPESPAVMAYLEPPEEVDPFNTLVLGPLTRSDLKRQLTCEASNNNITRPETVVVMIDMNLSPLTVSIRRPEEPLTAGREYQISCEVRGARPTPVINWWSGDTRLPMAMHTQTSGDGNITTSILVLKPTALDDLSLLRCQASSTPTNSSLDDVVTLAVYYVPSASAAFGSSLDEGNIKEGDDVYFECLIQANPRVTHVSWKHNEELLVHDVSGGIIVSNQSLVLQKVDRSQAGKYTCHAHNAIGDGHSNALQLDVKYAPVCSSGQVTTYAVGRYEDAEVTCEVEANPLEATFQWTFNNTADTIDVPQGRYTSTISHSVITYTPMTSLDYGTLLCWAANEIGSQQEPCLYHIVPAGKPDPPGNCTVSQKTRISLRIHCVSGSSGGLKQSFFLQARLHEGKHTINVTSDTPVFHVDGLKPKSKYNVYITARNDKGTSSQTHLTITSIGTTHHVYQLHDGPSEAEVRDGGKNGAPSGSSFSFGNQYLDTMSLSSLIPAAMGVGAGLILIIIILILLIIFRTRRPRRAPPSCSSLDGSEQTKTGSKSPSMTPKQTTSCSERDLQVESESDAEPDVIPLQEGLRGPDAEPIPAATLLPHDCYQYPAVSTSTLMHSMVSPHQGHREPNPPATVPLLEEGFKGTYIPSSYIPDHSHHLHHHHPPPPPHPSSHPHPHPPPSLTHHPHHHHHPEIHQSRDPLLPPASSTLPRKSHQGQHHHPVHPQPPPPPQGYDMVDPHSQPFPDVEGSLPPPLEYQTAESKRSAYSRENSQSLACEEDTPTTPLLSKRESSV